MGFFFSLIDFHKVFFKLSDSWRLTTKAMIYNQKLGLGEVSKVEDLKSGWLYFGYLK